jgi:hypothetical protein
MMLPMMPVDVHNMFFILISSLFYIKYLSHNLAKHIWLHTLSNGISHHTTQP